MKILFLSDDFPPTSFGGAGISTYELAKGMQKAGHEIFVITTVRNEKEASSSDYDGLKVYKIVSNYPERWRAYLGLYNLQVIGKLKAILVDIKPDIVHVNNIHYHLSYYSIKLAKKYSKATVLTFRDTMPITYGKLETRNYIDNLNPHITWFDIIKQAKKRWNPFRNIIIRRYVGYADKLFAVSNSLKQALEQNSIKNVGVMHTGMSLSEYHSYPEDQDKKQLFLAGRLSEAKGAKVVEKAMQIVKKEISEVELVSAGTNGKWLDREDMKIAYSRSSVVLVPSVYLDPFPRTVLEAMALGKPIIGTCYGGASEAIEDGVTGYVINPFRIEEMAEKIIELLEDPEKARRFGEAGRERVRDKFNLEQKVKEYLDWYERLIHTNSHI